jgi:hypothetical protein
VGLDGQSHPAAVNPSAATPDSGSRLARALQQLLTEAMQLPSHTFSVFRWQPASCCRFRPRASFFGIGDRHPVLVRLQSCEHSRDTVISPLAHSEKDDDR